MRRLRPLGPLVVALLAAGETHAQSPICTILRPAVRFAVLACSTAERCTSAGGVVSGDPSCRAA
jgi:hypothetical protein